jgi:hypothetical protein
MLVLSPPRTLLRLIAAFVLSKVRVRLYRFRASWFFLKFSRPLFLLRSSLAFFYSWASALSRSTSIINEASLEMADESRSLSIGSVCSFLLIGVPSSDKYLGKSQLSCTPVVPCLFSSEGVFAV